MTGILVRNNCVKLLCKEAITGRKSKSAWIKQAEIAIFALIRT